MDWLFVGYALPALAGLVGLAWIIAGAPLPRLRRRALHERPSAARLGLHIGPATPRKGGFSPREIGL